MADCLWWDRLGLWLCVAAALTIGCVGDSGTPAGPGGGASVVVPEELPGGEMPTVEEATELAQQIEEAVANGDDSAFRNAMDWDLLFDRATAGVDAPEGFATGFRAGMTKSVNEGGGLPGLIVQLVRQGASYRLLRVRQKDGEMRTLFRLLQAEAGVNYHDLLMVHGDDGSVRIGDIYVFLAAEDQSTTLRRFYVSLAVEENRSLLERLSGKEAEYGKHVTDVKAMSTNIRAGRPQDVLRIYASLPALLQADKGLLLLRYRAAAETGSDEEYLQRVLPEPFMGFCVGSRGGPTRGFPQS